MLDMRRETTVFLVCTLAMVASILCLWRTIDLGINGKLAFGEISSITTLMSFSIFSIFLLWINYALVRKIFYRNS
jgi:hypothetical protein